MAPSHQAGHEHRSLPVIDRLDAPPRHDVSLQSGLIGVRFPHWAFIYGRGPEVALDGRGEEVGEGDIGVLYGEGLVKQQGRGFGRAVDCAGGWGDEPGDGGDEEDRGRL